MTLIEDALRKLRKRLSYFCLKTSPQPLKMEQEVISLSRRSKVKGQRSKKLQ